MSQGGYLFAGGGTGGHLYPAIAVAAALRERDPDVAIQFVGSDRPLERQIVERAGYPHLALPVTSPATARRHPLRFVQAGWSSVRQALRCLRTLRPRVVIGCGGFASAPTVWAAARERIPVVLMEQNVLPGRATRRLCRWASAVCLPCEETRERLPTRVPAVVTGIPLRESVVRLAQQPLTAGDESTPPTLLILGGSLGAQSLNRAVCEGLAADPEFWRTWRIVHQTGLADLDDVRSRYHRLPLPVEVVGFHDDVPRALSEATVVVTRAGATTLAELACAARPAVVAPWKRSADDHQSLNARWYAERGGMLWGDDEMPRGGPEAAGDSAVTAPEPVWPAVQRLVRDASLRVRLSERLRELARPAATRAVLEVLDDIAR